MKDLASRLGNGIIRWILKESTQPSTPLCDFRRIASELRPGDVLLVEGRSRVSEVIKVVTQSPWTHAALYIGRLNEIQDPKIRTLVEAHHRGEPEDRLLLEALLGEGTVINSLDKYRRDHLRICRPTGLSPEDAQRVIAYSARRLGSDYDVRHLLDLARFLFPWGILPRRWRSSLFQHNAGTPTRTVCSCLLAEAFNSVDFPILPFIDRGDDGSIRFFKRNPRLFAPRDFDYSPYFAIIKYPFLGLEDLGIYRRLPWHQTDLQYNDEKAFSPDTAAAAESAGPHGAGSKVLRFALHPFAKTPAAQAGVITLRRG